MAVQPLVASTQTAAEEKFEAYKNRIDPHLVWQDLAALVWQDLAAVFHADPNAWQLEDNAHDFLRTQAWRHGGGGFGNIVAEMVADGATTIGALAVAGGIAQFRPVLVGDPDNVAQQMLDLVDQQATDGFMITSTVMPESLQDFASVIQLLKEASTETR